MSELGAGATATPRPELAIGKEQPLGPRRPGKAQSRFRRAAARWASQPLSSLARPRALAG